MWSVHHLVDSISKYYAEHRQRGSIIGTDEKVILGICAMDKKVCTVAVACLCLSPHHPSPALTMTR